MCLRPGLHIVVMVVSTVANMFLTVPSSFDTREHFDCNIAGLTGIVQFLPAAMIEGMSPALSQVVLKI